MSLLSESQTEPGSRAKRVSAADPTVRFKRHLDQVARDTEKLLERLLAPHSVAGEKMRPPRLLDAMRYASLGGGKRLRPFLVVESANLFGVPREQSLMAGVALECVHAIRSCTTT